MAITIMIILYYNKQITQFPMASSYNLRIRQKQLSPSNKKQASKNADQQQKVSPKTQHKKSQYKIIQDRVVNKIVNNNGSVVGSMAELLTNTATNNELFNIQPNSNSLLDSANNLKKAKLEDIEIKHSDIGESVVLQQSGFYKQFFVQRGIKRYQSAIQFGVDKNQSRSHKNPSNGIPFRKFQTQMQEKVVNIINKMKQQKPCLKQLQRIFTKILSVPAKDLRNKYFISGVAALVKIASDPSSSSTYQPVFIKKIQKSYQTLLQRIEQDLDNIQQFETVESNPRSQVSKDKIINRVFKILRKRLRQQKREMVQQKTITMVEQHTTNEGIHIKLLFEQLTSK